MYLIGSYAFENSPCTSVIFPNIGYLGDFCFALSQIKYVELSPSVYTIGKCCFYNTSVEKLILPTTSESLKIQEFAFGYLHFTNFTIPMNTIYIGYEAFRGSFIENLIIPGSIKQFSNWSFTDCYIKQCTIGIGISDIEEYCFAMSDIKNIEIPPTLINISQFAFMSSSIEEFTIPNNCHVSNNAFEDCFNLEK